MTARAAVATCLAATVAAAPAWAARRRADHWFDTYGEALKVAKEHGRPMVVCLLSDDKQVKTLKRMFARPELVRFQRVFIYTYDIATVKDNRIFCPLFRKYPPPEEGIRLPMLLVYFADAKEKVLHRVPGQPTTRALAEGLRTALLKHGPVVDARQMQQASELLQQAHAQFEKKDYPAAARLYAQVARMDLKMPGIEEAKGKLAFIHDLVNKRLAVARIDLAKKAYGPAVKALVAIHRDYGFLAAGRQAGVELRKLRRVPEARAALQAAQQGAEPPTPGTARPAIPPALAAAPRPEDDPEAFTEEELDALDRLGQPDPDADGAQAQRNEQQARRLLRLARNWLANKRPQRARQLLRRIIDQYPDTIAARQARSLLGELD